MIRRNEKCLDNSEHTKLVYRN